MKKISSFLIAASLSIFITMGLTSCPGPVNPAEKPETQTPADTTQPAGTGGIKITVTIPAKTNNLSILRIDTSVQTNFDGAPEIYRMSNNTNAPVTKTFTDRYGIVSGKTYKYATEIDWSGNKQELGESVTATANGWAYPQIATAPQVHFDESTFELVYDTVPTLKFSNNEHYDFRLQSDYRKITPEWMHDGGEDQHGDYTDWGCCEYPGYESGDDYGENQAHPRIGFGDDCRGFELTFAEVTLMVHLEDGIDYVTFYGQQGLNYLHNNWNYPRTIYIPNKVEEKTIGDTNRSEIEFTIRVPPRTRNVQLMLKPQNSEPIEIASKPYGEEHETTEWTTIILKDLYTHTAATPNDYFIAYNGKRYDRDQELRFTPQKNALQAPSVSDLNFSFDNHQIVTRNTWPTVTFSNGENAKIQHEWLCLDYYDTAFPENPYTNILLMFDNNDDKNRELLRDRPNLPDGQVLTLKSARYNFAIQESDGFVWDQHVFLPASEMSNIPATITIDRSAAQDVGIPKEQQIKMEVNIPAGTENLMILRREVNEDRSPKTEFTPIAAQYPANNDPENYPHNYTRAFVDHYAVKKDCYYEYQVDYFDENWGCVDSKNLGIYQADYNGYQKPVLASGSNYPNITLDFEEENLRFEIKNSNVLDTMDYKGAPKPAWITYNFHYDNMQYGFGNWLGSGEEQKVVHNPLSDYINAPTGRLALTNFQVNLQYQGDYFDSFFEYDIDQLDSDKIVTEIWRESNEMQNGGFEYKISLPALSGGVENVNDVMIQARVKPAVNADEWPVNRMDPSVRKGRLDGGLFNGRVQNGFVTYKDYFGYEIGKTYQVRALVAINYYDEIIEIPLGEVTATKNSLPYPEFAEGKAPVFAWDAENQSLSITNDPELAVSDDILNLWGCTINDWGWCITLSYQDSEDDAKGFWPWFCLKHDGGCPEIEPRKLQTIPAENELGESYTLNAIEYFVDIYINGEGISQNIVIPVTALGDAQTLVRTEN